jgi:hypothetical protein
MASRSTHERVQDHRAMAALGGPKHVDRPSLTVQLGSCGCGGTTLRPSTATAAKPMRSGVHAGEGRGVVGVGGSGRGWAG